MPRPPKSTKATASQSRAPGTSFQNAALPEATGTVRSRPSTRQWSSKKLETMAQQRDRVTVSRFLQEQVPVVNYCVQTLPKEAIGKGIGLKSISANLEFRQAATDYFARWANSKACDLRKESTFFQLQTRWLSAILGDGSAFVQKLQGDPSTRAWKLTDKSKRRCQLQTFTRDQIGSPQQTAPTAKDAPRWQDGLLYSSLDQLQAIRILLDDDTPGATTRTQDIPAEFVFHLKDNIRFNQKHGIPCLFRSGNDLLDSLDLKAVRKHSAKIRAALIGATESRDGQAPTAIQAAITGQTTGTPATDTGKRFFEIHDGAVMIPLSKDEKITFFTAQGEPVNYAELLETLTTPIVYNFGYPPEWIFSLGKLGGAALRAIIRKVAAAHENLRSLLYPFLQWVWEYIISDAMLPGGELYQFATVEDWNEIDFVTDPDPSVDLGRDHKAEMDRLDANLMTAEDYVESRSGMSGTATRHAAIDEKLDTIRYAVHRATGTPMEQVIIPASLAMILAIPSRTLMAASGMLTTLSPENIAEEIAKATAASA